MQEESYTSQASFWNKDVITVYKSDDTEEHHFSGKKTHLEQYRTASGQVLNADINGALNIILIKWMCKLPRSYDFKYEVLSCSSSPS